MPTNNSTIGGNSHIKVVLSSTIGGNSNLVLTARDIAINAKIVVKQFIELLSTLTYSSPGASDKQAEIDEILQPVPSAPPALVATDLATGDSIKLDWTTSGAPGYNVYKSTGGPFVKVNSIPLAPGELSYNVGGLSIGVSVTFHIKGVNGEGVESGPSPSAVAIPTLDLTQSKFTSPTWLVKINGSEDSDIILEEVRLGYGSDFSRSVFHKPEDSPSLADGDSVEVVVNSRSIFKGKIRGITSSISNSGLRTNYNALSDITDLTKTLVSQNKPSGTSFNTREDIQFFIGVFSPGLTILGKKNADDILGKILGYIPAGAPSSFPGEIVITDQNKLQAVEHVLRQIGNFKVFFNQATNRLEIYQIGSGGKSQRELGAGHIIDFNKTTSTQDVIGSVTIKSAPVRVHIRSFVPSWADLILRRDSNGNLVESTQVGGLNVGNVTVEGYLNSPPEILYDGLRSALPSHAGFTDGLWPGGFDTQTGEPLEKQDAAFRSAIVKVGHFQPDWEGLSAEVKYSGTSSATILLSNIPRIWTAETIVATVPAPGGFAGTLEFQVLKEFNFRRGPLRVSYEFDQAPLEVTVGGGSGTANRRITDQSYRPTASSGFSNISTVLTDMTTRATNEVARLGFTPISGTMTILGDETLDLRTTVNGMDVTSVTHRFTNGYTVQLQLTKEPPLFEFVRDPAVDFVPEQDENRVRQTRTVVDEQTFEIIHIDTSGNKNTLTPSTGVPSDPDKGPDSPFGKWY